MVRLGKKIRTTRYEVLCMQMNKEGEVLTQARIHIHDSLEEAETAVIAEMANDELSRKVFGPYFQERAYRIVERDSEANENEEPRYWDFMKEE